MIGPTPVPSSSTTRTSRPSVGMARAALLSPMTRNEPRPVWPMKMPSGMAIAAAIADRRSGIGELLKQQIPNPVRALPVGRISQIGEEVHAVRRFLEPGQRATLNEQDQRVSYQRQCQHQHQTDDDRRVEEAPEAKVEELAERSTADQDCHADQSDIRHRDDPKTGEDHRHGERQLHPEQPAQPAITDC